MRKAVFRLILVLLLAYVLTWAVLQGFNHAPGA